MKIHIIDHCRLCGGKELTEIINIGEQKLTGIFPEAEGFVEGGVLRLVKCSKDGGCGLVQLDRSFENELMYGDNYGYRSGLNSSMVEHLSDITKKVLRWGVLRKGDIVVDIGSNDGTLLRTYGDNSDLQLEKVGIDPTGKTFSKYYEDGIILIEDFFSAKVYKAVKGDKKAKVVTSIAMFYDLEDPVDFAKQIYEVLSEDGLWITEQSYYPAMIDTFSYDTICHEHIEYYSLLQVEWIAQNSGFKVIDVETNDINGGSFKVVFCKNDAHYIEKESVQKFRMVEQSRGVNSIGFAELFVKEINNNKEILLKFLREQKKNNKLVLGYGASTKGNVVLQYCGITRDLLPCIAEVNEDKYGKVTPGTGIPIVSEKEAKSMQPDFFLVLPWHFKKNILEREEEYRLKSKCKFVFALPKFEIV